MTYKKYLVLSATLLTLPLFAKSEPKKPFFGNQAPPKPVHEKTDNLELMYVFNKSNIDNLNYIIDTSSSIIGNKRIPTNFQWGEQGQITWTKKLPNSIYSIVTSFYALHNHFNYYATEASPSSLTSISLTATNQYFGSISLTSSSPTRPYTYSQHNQFNLYDIDLFVKADLRNTKHAKFAIYGGAILAGYNFKSVQEGTRFLTTGQILSESYRMSNTDYYFGPNAKILAAAPFFNNHVELSLRAGFGLMMSFNSLSAFRQTINPISTSVQKNVYGYSNTFRFAYQFDILAQVAFCFKDFCVASGITQFYYNASKPDNIITFGGPFIKASYTF